MGKLVEEGMKAGHLLAVEGCCPARRARACAFQRKGNGDRRSFTESKEIIGGLVIVKAD